MRIPEECYVMSKEEAESIDQQDKKSGEYEEPPMRSDICAYVDRSCTSKCVSHQISYKRETPGYEYCMRLVLEFHRMVE